MKITKRKGNQVFDIEVKRFYLPYEITDKCPDCGRLVEASETRNYFSYPCIGAPTEVTFYCEHMSEEEMNSLPEGAELESETEWSRKVRIDLTLKAVR